MTNHINPGEVARAFITTSPVPEAMRAQGYVSRMIDVSEVRVGMIRVLGGEVTDVRTTKSGKTVYITCGIGPEGLRPTSRIACWVKA